MSSADDALPVRVAVTLMHAALQHVADAANIDLLHVKGPALDPALLQRGRDGLVEARSSSDADVLVRPRDAERFLGLLRDLGWQQQATFVTGSPFEHAANVWSDELGHADVHRHFPGITVAPEEAFEEMWQARQHLELAHRPCATPSLAHQRLLLLLHTARAGAVDTPDKRRAWDDATETEREELRGLADHLGATVALAAAIGELDRHHDSPDFLLWDQFSRRPDHSRTEEWRARFRAARGLGEKLHVLRRALIINTDRLAMELGHRPTPAEQARAQVQRILRGFRELGDRP